MSTGDLSRYQIVREIARGGMGVVHEAVETALGRRVAIKRLLDDPDPDALRRFEREASAAAGLSHPGLVRIYALGRDGGTPFIVMDLIDGPSLDDAELERMPIERAVHVLERVAEAVGHAHRHGVVHRDLKPQNVLLGPGDRPVVTDFGLARPAGASRLTATGDIPGTPRYMAPEQVRGEPTCPATDVWALGVMLHETLSRRPPFEGGSLAELFEAILHGDPGPLPATGAAAALAGVCGRALEKDPARRYADAGELADELARWRRGDPLVATTAGPVRRLARRLRRRPAWLAVALLVALAVAAGGGWQWSAARRARAVRQLGREARAAFAGGRWSEALVAAELALGHGPDARLAQLAADCRARIERGQAASRSARARRETDGRFAAAIESAARVIHEARAAFYVRDMDIHGHLRRVASAVEGLDRLARTPAGRGSGALWTELGVGLHVVGRAREAEAALLRAAETGHEDGRISYTLGRLHLERALAQLHVALGNEAMIHRLRTSAKLSQAALRLLEQPLQDWLGARPIDRHVAEVCRALATGRSDLAVRLCEQGLERFEREPGTEVYWAVLGRERPGEAALHAYEQGLAVRPHDAWLRYLRGTWHLGQGHLDRALADLDAALRLDPANALCLSNRGVVRQRKGDLDGAMADFDRALALDPSMAGVHVNRAMVHGARGDTDAALTSLDQALALNPRLGLAYLGRGRVRQQRGDHVRALADLDRAIGLRPDLPAIFESRAASRHEVGDLRGEVADLEQALRRDPRAARLWYRRARARGALRDHAGALADAARAIELDPDHAMAYHQRGLSRHALGDDAAARADLDRSVALRPDAASSYHNRGLALARMNDHRGARRDYDRGIELDPRSAALFCDRGLARERLGDLPGALRDLDRSIRLDPRMVRALNNRGLVRMRVNDLEGAMADFRRTLELDPRAWRSWGLFAVCLYRSGRIDEGERAFARAIELAPAEAGRQIAATRRGLRQRRR